VAVDDAAPSAVDERTAAEALFVVKPDAPPAEAADTEEGLKGGEELRLGKDDEASRRAALVDERSAELPLRALEDEDGDSSPDRDEDEDIAVDERSGDDVGAEVKADITAPADIVVEPVPDNEDEEEAVASVEDDGRDAEQDEEDQADDEDELKLPAPGSDDGESVDRACAVTEDVEDDEDEPGAGGGSALLALFAMACISAVTLSAAVVLSRGDCTMNSVWSM
jgi:hypothetical protein